VFRLHERLPVKSVKMLPLPTSAHLTAVEQRW